MNKIEALTERAQMARRRGESSIELPVSVVLQLLSIANLIYTNQPGAAENKSRDFANYWLYDTVFPSEPEDP